VSDKQKESFHSILTSDKHHPTLTTSERNNTIVCMFGVKSPRISAYGIHEWIFETLDIAEEDLQMIQIDGPRRHVYIKFKHLEPMF
jgi:hypothetical protein